MGRAEKSKTGAKANGKVRLESKAKPGHSRSAQADKARFYAKQAFGNGALAKDAEDQALKSIIDEFIALEKDKIDNYPTEEKNKLALEAELFFSGAVSLKEEFLKIKKETEKEEIKAELESITGKIKELEMAENPPGGEAKLKQYLDDFHKLTKKIK